MNLKNKDMAPKEQLSEELDIRKMDWEAMKNVDLTTIDRSTLVDIKDVFIDPNLPKKERLASFVKQIKNPYCYKHGKIVVKLLFNQNGPTLEEKLINYFKSLGNCETSL